MTEIGLNYGSWLGMYSHIHVNGTQPGLEKETARRLHSVDEKNFVERYYVVQMADNNSPKGLMERREGVIPTEELPHYCNASKFSIVYAWMYTVHIRY